MFSGFVVIQCQSCYLNFSQPVEGNQLSNQSINKLLNQSHFQSIEVCKQLALVHFSQLMALPVEWDRSSNQSLNQSTNHSINPIFRVSRCTSNWGWCGWVSWWRCRLTVFRRPWPFSSTTWCTRSATGRTTRSNWRHSWRRNGHAIPAFTPSSYWVSWWNDCCWGWEEVLWVFSFKSLKCLTYFTPSLNFCGHKNNLFLKLWQTLLNIWIVVPFKHIIGKQMALKFMMLMSHKLLSWDLQVKMII